MSYKKILKAVGIVGIAAVCCIGCGEKPDGDDDTPDVPPSEVDADSGEAGDDSYTYTGKTVTIGNQTWMVENLDRATNKSKCYANSPDSCAKYGRLYTWADARRACPAGWHLPNDAEWTALSDSAGGSPNAGTKLKSPSGWFEYDGVPAGTDDYGFSALPSGLGTSAGYFSGIRNSAFWWSATEHDTSSAIGRHMGFCTRSVVRNTYSKALLYSVRCVRD
jgi:uncharacterized protein (TIGR02145 family)